MMKIFGTIRRNAFPVSLFLTVFLLVTGCELPVTTEVGETTVDAALPTPPVSLNTVCDPFGGGATQRDRGLKGEIYYLPENLPHYARVIDYIQNGNRVDANLYLNKISIPTRKFDDGFVTTQGEVLKTPEGNTLYEWFALRLDSNLKLSHSDRAGRYQFAILADDGAILKGKVGDEWKMIVDNDGTHASRFVVSREPITFDHSTEIPIELQYYQGPRLHIAFTLLWREWPETGEDWLDPMDGRSGNDLFFDYNQSPSAPKQAWHEILARGWKPVDASNFVLPQGAPQNNCPPPGDPGDNDPPVEDPGEPGSFAIVGFDAASSVNNMAVIWQTVNFPSTSKVYWGLSADNLNNNVNTGATRSTVHQLGISGLEPSTAYYLQAESTNAAGETIRSNIIRKVTK